MLEKFPFVGTKGSTSISTEKYNVLFKSINQSINRSISQSIGQSINQSINQTIKQSIYQSIRYAHFILTFGKIHVEKGSRILIQILDAS